MHSASNHNLEASVKEGYEVTDMNTTLIGTFIIALFMMMFGAVLTIIVVLRGFEESRPALNDTPASALAVEGMQIPDEPRLQMDPVKDMEKAFDENVRSIEGYGWISQEAGVERAHIPIEEAMKRVAEGDAPYRQEPTAAAEEMVDPFAEDAL